MTKVPGPVLENEDEVCLYSVVEVLLQPGFDVRLREILLPWSTLTVASDDVAGQFADLFGRGIRMSKNLLGQLRIDIRLEVELKCHTFG